MTKTFRAAASAYFVLVGLLSIPVLIFSFGLLRGVAFDADFLIAVLALPLSFSAWLAGFRLSVSEDAISYRSLFGGTRSAKVSEIASIGLAPAAPVTRSPLGLRVRLRDGTGFVINVKPFPSEATTMLLSVQVPNKPIHTTCEDARA